MPLTNRRRARRNKEIKLQETSDAEAPDSSPTRPSNKKRKVNRRQPSPQPRQPVKTEESADEADDSSPDNEVSENQDLVDMVISCLSVPRDDVRVMRDHSNAKTENKQSIRAYAKIAGRNWTYYVKTLHVNIGREPDREQRIDEQSSPVTIAARALPEVHVDLGPGKFVSRLHAEIFYDGEQTAAWHIRVNGRNGVRLNNVVLKRGTDAILSCGDIIEIANTQMMFVTPGDQANIHSSFVERAHRIANGEESQDWDAAQHAHPRPPQSTDDPADSIVTAAASGGQASLASAPHILKRQVTPPPRSPDTSGARTAKHSPLYNRGMMMESTEEIDYSKDSAKDLKPPYSYATLIAQAIFSSEEEKLTLNHIYTWIVNKYAFYRHSQSGWQNSIRHNLSLNKAFQKVPRRTDEPGKGMKWQIVPEYREEYWRRQARKGNQSSAPSSPATKDVSSRNANGLGTVFSAGKRSPQLSSPGFSSFPVAPVEAYTPERGSRTAHALRNARPDYEEPSPLPTRTAKKSLTDNNDNAGNNSNSASTASRAYGLSDNVAKSPPILSSSYYDDGPSSMITPAPQRQQPRLPPPSTAQIPSKFMPMSSPAQFWKFAEIGSTPARPVQDTSPLKGESGDGLGNLPSSSPPPDLVSPSKPGMAFGHGGRSLPPLDEGDEGGEGEEEGEGEGEEREKEEEAGGERKEETEKEKEKEEEEDKPSYNNNNNNNANGAGSGSSQDQDPPDGNRHNNDNKPGPGDDEEEEEGGFDLARGFQPIGSYHRQMSNAARATATS